MSLVESIEQRLKNPIPLRHEGNFGLKHAEVHEGQLKVQHECLLCDRNDHKTHYPIATRVSDDATKTRMIQVSN